MSPANAAQVILAIIAVFGVIFAGFRWVYKRGGAEAEIVTALQQNTQATGELTTAFHGFRETVSGELRALDVRVSQIEATQNGSNPALRDAGSPGRH